MEIKLIIPFRKLNINMKNILHESSLTSGNASDFAQTWVISLGLSLYKCPRIHCNARTYGNSGCDFRKMQNHRIFFKDCTINDGVKSNESRQPTSFADFGRT